MKVIDPGHVYELEWLDGKPRYSVEGHSAWPENRLKFVKREGAGYPGNVGHHPGTNLQEVLRAMIERVKYLEAQVSHPNNAGILVNLRHSLWLLEQRAAERHGRPFELSWAAGIEEMPVCGRCGHIGCDGRCIVHAKPEERFGFPDHIDREGKGHYRKP
jgi:hypothetical protein